MDSNQKHRIHNMRSRGFTYRQIADGLGLSMNTIKSYCHRHDIQKGLCKNCGKPLTNIPNHKPKIFCSDNCRGEWWRINRDQMQMKAVYHFNCAHCGRPFDSYGNQSRKFCSRECYLSYRYGVP